MRLQRTHLSVTPWRHPASCQPIRFSTELISAKIDEAHSQSLPHSDHHGLLAHTVKIGMDIEYCCSHTGSVVMSRTCRAKQLVQLRFSGK